MASTTLWSMSRWRHVWWRWLRTTDATTHTTFHHLNRWWTAYSSRWSSKSLWRAHHSTMHSWRWVPHGHLHTSINWYCLSRATHHRTRSFGSSSIESHSSWLLTRRCFSTHSYYILTPKQYKPQRPHNFSLHCFWHLIIGGIFFRSLLFDFENPEFLGIVEHEVHMLVKCNHGADE